MFETSQKSYCWTPTKCSFAGKRLQYPNLLICSSLANQYYMIMLVVQFSWFRKGVWWSPRKNTSPKFCPSSCWFVDFRTQTAQRWDGAERFWDVAHARKVFDFGNAGGLFCASFFQRVLFDSKGRCIGTPYHLVSTLWKIQVFVHFFTCRDQTTLAECKEVNS